MRPAIFLDRDGVLNKAFVHRGKPYPPASIDDFELLPGVRAATRALREAGYYIVVVTNQPDVGNGTQRRELVEEMNNYLLACGLCDEVRVCYHSEVDRCECRKPLPGMLLASARENGIDLTKSWMVGDRWRDVGAGIAAGCRTCFIDYGYAETPSNANWGSKVGGAPDIIAKSMAQAAEYILLINSNCKE